jgi:hypothetical protein
MAEIQLFTPGLSNTAVVTVRGSSTGIELVAMGSSTVVGGADYSVLVTNDGGLTSFITFAASAGHTATTSGVPILAGTQQMYTVPRSNRFVRGITAAASTSSGPCYFSVGQGA